MEINNIIDYLVKAADYPEKTIKESCKKNNKEAIGCVVPYAPEEIVYAANCIPVGIWGGQVELTKARTYLGSMKYTHEEMMGKIEQLSGGQKAKLIFIGMILRESNVLILDEPTRNFSPLSNPVIRQILTDFGGAIISVTHDRKFLSEVCSKVYRLTPEGLEPF